MGTEAAAAASAALEQGQSIAHDTAHGAVAAGVHSERPLASSIRSALHELRAGNNVAAAREVCCGNSSLPLILGICLPVVLTAVSGAHHHH